MPTILQLSKKFPQKRAFITGCASGLGKEMCNQLSNDGWTIGITNINTEQLQTTADQIQKNGGKSRSYIFDVSNREAYQKATNRFLESFGGINLLVNNAGVGDGDLFEEYGLANWQWMVGINFMGGVNGCHFFIPVMKQQQSGHIINISSAAAFSAGPKMAPYNATKAAVTSLSETLHTELKPHNVGISVTMTTYFKTNIDQHWRGSQESKEFARKMIELGLETEIVARKMLEKVGKGKFYIVFPFDANWFRFMHRFFPGLFLWVKSWLFRNEGRFKNT